jgi:hypothetical protein
VGESLCSLSTSWLLTSDYRLPSWCHNSLCIPINMCRKLMHQTTLSLQILFPPSAHFSTVCRTDAGRVGLSRNMLRTSHIPHLTPHTFSHR